MMPIKRSELELDKNGKIVGHNNCYTTKAELIVDLISKTNINDTIKIDNKRFSRITDIYEIRDKRLFKIKLNFDAFRGRKDLTFIVDDNLRMIRLEEFELSNN